MIQTVISFIIGMQICIGLFHAGIGLEDWKNTGAYDSQTLYLLLLGLSTWLIQKRLQKIPVHMRSISIIFQHGFLLGIVSWFYYQSWGNSWETFFIGYIVFMLVAMIVTMIIESQFQIFLGSGNWGIPEVLWRLGTLITLINTVTIPVIFIVLHETLATVWVYFGLSWAFLWKEGPNDATENILKKI